MNLVGVDDSLALAPKVKYASVGVPMRKEECWRDVQRTSGNSCQRRSAREKVEAEEQKLARRALTMPDGDNVMTIEPDDAKGARG